MHMREDARWHGNGNVRVISQLHYLYDPYQMLRDKRPARLLFSATMLQEWCLRFLKRQLLRALMQ